MASLLEIPHREGIAQNGGVDSFAGHPCTTAQPQKKQRDGIGSQGLTPFREEECSFSRLGVRFDQTSVIQIPEEVVQPVCSQWDPTLFSVRPLNPHLALCSVHIPHA